MSAEELHLVVPGPIDQRTGGYLYDARMTSELTALGWTVVVHELMGSFPDGDARAESSLSQTLADLPERARVLLDGLAMGALPGPMHAERSRMRLLALVHHPLADETGTSAAERERLAALEREALAACSGAIVTSEYSAERLAAYGVPRRRVRPVPPGVDPAPPAQGPGPGEPPRFLCVGAVVPRKGQDVLVRALARLAHQPWSCVCAGSLTRDPSFARTVLRQVEETGLAERIRLVGERSAQDLEELYSSASVFVLPSHLEGYGMALAEAMVRGLPVVSTTGGAVPHTVPAGTGILVPPGDELALARALGLLLADREGARRRAELASAALEHGLTLPNWEQAAIAFERAVLELSDE